jgi:acetoin utilization deacetylase AcuC-like enzyme
MRAGEYALMHVQLINLRDFRPATFAEVTAIHSERYVNMLEEVCVMYAAALAGASGRCVLLEVLQSFLQCHIDCSTSIAHCSCCNLPQVVLRRAPTLVDADTYITPSSFDDAIKARPCPLKSLRDTTGLPPCHLLEGTETC